MRAGRTTIVLDMDSSVSETHGPQEGSAYNGHFTCTCFHPLFVFDQFGDLERCALRPAKVPGRFRLRKPGDLRVPGSRGLQKHDPATAERGAAGEHWLAAEASGGPTAA